VTRDQNIELRVVVVIDFKERGGRGHCHANQNQKGHHSPGDFYLGTLMKLRRNDSTGFTVINDGVEHHTKHADTDDDTNNHDEHMKIVDLSTNRRDARRHIDLIVSKCCCRQSHQGH